jgi:hypothetical protein
MKKIIVALLLIFGSVTAVTYSYSPALVCSNAGSHTDCWPASTTSVATYEDQYRCIEIGDGYEVCLIGTESYFCIETSGGEKECVKL